MTKYLVRLVDPEETLPANIDGRDRRAFEREGRHAIGLVVAPGQTLPDQLKQRPELWQTWVAWHALRRDKLWTDDFAAFDARCDGVTLAEGEELNSEDPTKPAQSAG